MTDTQPLRLGLIGLGAFGSRVAMRLLWNGYHTLGVYDINDITVRVFGNDYGAMGLGSPRMVAQTSDVVLTILPSASELREACFGWESIAKGFPDGGIIVDLGMTDPIDTIAIARQLAERNILLIDAPAFGSAAQAKEGDLTLIVGGEEAAVGRVQPVLNTLAKRIIRAGGSGSAQAASAVAAFLQASQIQANAEAIRLGSRFGFQPADVLNICNELGGRSLGNVIANDLATRRFESGRQLGLVRRNLSIAADLASRSGIRSPLLEVASTSWAAAENQLGYGADQSAILKWVEQLIIRDEKTDRATDSTPAV